MKISALIMTSTNHGGLQKCLTALQKAWDDRCDDTDELEVLVVDIGGEKAETQKAMLASGCKNLFWVPVEQWWNRSRAMNYVVHKAATGGLLLFLSDDCLVSDELFQQLHDARRATRADIIGPLLLADDQTIFAAGIGLTKNLAPSFRGHLLDLHEYAPAEGRAMLAVPFYCALVTRETFDELEGFDVEFQNGIEDVDFCLRAREKGRAIRLWTDVTCLCDGDSSNDLVPRTGARIVSMALGFASFARRWLIGDKPRIDVILGIGGEEERHEVAPGGGVADDAGARSSDAA